MNSFGGDAILTTYLWNDTFSECVYFSSQFETTQNEGICSASIRIELSSQRKLFLGFVYVLPELDLSDLTECRAEST